MSERPVVLVCKSPAFDSVYLNEKEAQDAMLAGVALDRVGVPRCDGERVLSLAERVCWLQRAHGYMVLLEPVKFIPENQVL